MEGGGGGRGRGEIPPSRKTEEEDVVVVLPLREMGCVHTVVQKTRIATLCFGKDPQSDCSPSSIFLFNEDVLLSKLGQSKF